MAQAGALTTVCLGEGEKLSKSLWEIITLSLPPKMVYFSFVATSVPSPEDEQVPMDDTSRDRNQIALGTEEEYSSLTFTRAEATVLAPSPSNHLPLCHELLK